MKKAAVVKGIINYIFAMIFAIIFGLFLDANVGWFILVTLILAPLLSVFFAWLSARMITVSCEMENALLSKGDICFMTFTVRNRSIFPTPPIAVMLANETGVRSENRELLVSVLSKSSQSFRVEFKAKICGISLVGIEKIRVTDYLGLFSVRVKNVNYEELRSKVAVIPDIAELSARDDNLLKVMHSSLHMDDGEDTVDSYAFAFGGFPGYDNREYIPGDPLKRINWKQSAKRDKLLVRLDDEMAARAIHVVLDSAFEKNKVDLARAGSLFQYRDFEKDEILLKIAEDAVENALGMVRILIRHNYTVNFYARIQQTFVCFNIQDEVGLEELRRELAYFSFYPGADVPRLPSENGFGEKVGLFSTPNAYEDVYEILEAAGVNVHTTIYAVLEEAVKLNQGEGSISLGRKQVIKKKKTVKEWFWNLTKGAMIPYLLGLLLSTIVFSIFGIPLKSYWTPAQMAVCLLAVIYCELIREHRVIGTMTTFLILMMLIPIPAKMAFGNGALNYMHWFMSAGDSVETTTSYLLSLLLVFTPFFAMTTFYFTRVLYRTSFLMLTSLIPFVIYVKVMLPFRVTQVVFVTVLNIAAFMLHYRTIRDKEKKIVGYGAGLISLGLYVLIFVLVGLAVPEAETKYYYLFENQFLGGNITERVPEEFSEMSEHSGNADGFNELNDRKLYVVKQVEAGANLYFNRQTFDLYDFENHRWNGLKYYTEPVYSLNEWTMNRRQGSLTRLLDAMHCADSYEPDLLEQYGLEDIPKDYGDTRQLYIVETMNFPSAAYVVPSGTYEIAMIKNGDEDKEHTYVTRAGIYLRDEGMLNGYLDYSVEYYDESWLRNQFLAAGGADFTTDESIEMLQHIHDVLHQNGEKKHALVVEYFIEQAKDAMEYKKACMANTAAIPEEVRRLAEEITIDCKYDREKAEALQGYFRKQGFVYDLSYKAPDDSVEYFLFEGKTGTCSDYASAYVLMARAAGLTVRYVEGFSPDMEYNGDYVMRTNNGHAYPEVYIDNVGYVVYEATMPAVYGRRRNSNGLTSYLAAVLMQIAGVFVTVSAIIIVTLFAHKIITPYVKEWVFIIRVKKAQPKTAVVLLYRRIQSKYTEEEIRNAAYLTPYEYALEFEETYGQEDFGLSQLVEEVVYIGKPADISHKERALHFYQRTKAELKKWKKNQKKK